MNKAVVIAAATGGILLLGCLGSPSALHTLHGWLGTHDAVTSTAPATADHARLTGAVAPLPHAMVPVFAAVSDHPPTTTQALPVPRADVAGNGSPTQELADRQARSNETYRRLQESFRAREAQEAANPQKKSAHSAGGTGVPSLVCEPNQHGVAIIHEPIPFGFIFDPKEYPNGRIELRNVQNVPLVVTVHGEDQVLVNGQPAVTGIAYPLDGSLEITSPGQVRIHVAPGNATADALDGRG